MPSSKKRPNEGSFGSSTSPPLKRRKLSPTLVAIIFSSSKWVNAVPVEVWRDKVCKQFLTLKELSILRRTHTSFLDFWHHAMKQNVIRVPQGCPTVEKAMALAVVFSERKQYTATEPLRIVLDKGVHELVGNGKTLEVTCSHITFVGKGKDHTTIRGGFYVCNKQNVSFEQMTITNPNEAGVELEGSATNVDVLKCTIKECEDAGLYAHAGATVTATQCEFMANVGDGVNCDDQHTTARLNNCTMHHNGENGVYAFFGAVVDLLGTKTDIHANKCDGMLAKVGGKVNIHLPSKHNTSHGNGKENRNGSIANINDDGTFTHEAVMEVEDDDAD